MNKYLIWRNGNSWDYALSIAATWIWAPAIFVSSGMAHNNGIYGLLWFLIPNILTLVVFGAISGKLVRPEGCNLEDAIRGGNHYQVVLHKFVSTLLLIMSTLVQLAGISVILSGWGVDKNIACFGTLGVCLAFSFQGIRACILTDRWKYMILLACAILLMLVTFGIGTFQGFDGVNHPSFAHISATFGITTCIGLFAAPYADSTFWQRVFCIKKEDRFRVFSLSALTFGVIPTLFGIMGFFYGGDNTWTLSSVFGSGILGIVLVVAVLCALFSTIDSNICAMSSLWCVHTQEDDLDRTAHRITTVGFTTVIAVMSVMFSSDIVSLFLMYGTLRTCIAIPTVLLLLNRYSMGRLNVLTTIALLVATIGYCYVNKHCPSYIWAVTLLTFLLPIFSYRRIPHD